jgi:hypothetical protein
VVKPVKHAKNRRTRTTWRKGIKSPNPAGRPPVGTTLAEAVRERWPPGRLVALASSLAQSKSAAIKLRAIEWLADRGYGRQATEPTVAVNIANGMSAHAALLEQVCSEVPTRRLGRLAELRAKQALPVDATATNDNPETANEENT